MKRRIEIDGGVVPVEFLRNAGTSRLADVIDIMALAFANDPGYRQVSGAAGERCQRHIRQMIRSTADVFSRTGNPVQGVVADGELLAVALVEAPGSSFPYATALRAVLRLATNASPAVAFRALRASLATLRAQPKEPHHFLSMIAVHPKAQGRGFGRRLLEQLNADCDAEAGSIGIALDTSNPNNIGLYERFGYRVTGELGIPNLPAWSMFRPRGAPRPGAEPDPAA